MHTQINIYTNIYINTYISRSLQCKYLYLYISCVIYPPIAESLFSPPWPSGLGSLAPPRVDPPDFPARPPPGWWDFQGGSAASALASKPPARVWTCKQPCLDGVFCSLPLSRSMLATSGATSVNKRSITSFVTSVVAPQKSQTIKVPNFEWFKFPTYKIVFGENLFLQRSLDFQGIYIMYIYICIYGKIHYYNSQTWMIRAFWGGFRTKLSFGVT